MRELLSLLAPPRCVACRALCVPGAHLCGRCMASLDSCPPPPPIRLAGVDVAWATAPHEGVARALVVALKFGALLPVSDLMARRIRDRAPAGTLRGALVPVPPAPLRLLRRGFDPAERIASRLATLSGIPYHPCLARSNGRRQVGRTRASRLARPPRVWASDRVPAAALLVDDVQTTGATLTACAAALRGAGCERVAAVTFARTL